MEQCNNEKIYAIILGREQKIALAELSAVMRRFGFDFCPDSDNYYCSKLKAENSDRNSSRYCSNNKCYSILSLQDNIVIIKLTQNSKAKNQKDEHVHLAETLMSQLGGSIKLFELSDKSIQPDMISKSLVSELSKDNSSGTLNFAISDYSGSISVKELNQIGIQTKIHARKRRPVRYIASKESQLSSATSYHKIWKSQGVEFGLFKFVIPSPFGTLRVNSAEESYSRVSDSTDGGGHKNNEIMKQWNNELLIGRLIATSNPDEWSERDYGKPAGDKYSGMMPPKLARMLVNLALDPAITKKQDTSSKQIPNSNTQISNNEAVKHWNNEDQKPTVFDPFCGSGNILMEAALLGCDIIGSDISDKAIQDTKINLEWLCNSKFKIQNLKFIENFKSKIENSVFMADATAFDFTSKLTPNKLNTCIIVTEPYLGKPKKTQNSKAKIQDEINELKALYLSFFKNLLAIIHYSSFIIHCICFVFPMIETTDAGTVSLYDECIDDLRKMGYNPVRTLKYGRDYQVVKRVIALFTTNSNHEARNPKQ